MHDAWRLIPLSDGTGVEQMSIDNWLLTQHSLGLQPSCLRFYTWESPTISLGYHQHQFPDHWNNLEYKGQKVDLVRRPTGGRAVLHQGDLTYSLVTSGLKGSRRDMYRQLCQFLITGCKGLGVELGFGTAGRGYIKNPNCFGTSTAADLVTSGGYKLIGSAQVYREGCILQHGSVRLNQDSVLFEAVFGEDTSASQQPNVDSRQLIDSLVDAARNDFKISFEHQALTPTEIRAAMTTHQIKLERRSD